MPAPGSQDPNARRDILARRGPGHTSEGGAGITFGPAADYTFTADDIATPGSWYSDSGVKVIPWTPTKSGLLVLTIGDDNEDSDFGAGNFDTFIYAGDVEDTDYPGLTDASGDFNLGNAALPDVFPPHLTAPVHVTAGQAYTITLVDWQGPGAVGHRYPLDGILNGLAPFGGLAPVLELLGTTLPIPRPPSYLEALLGVNDDDTLGARLQPPQISHEIDCIAVRNLDAFTIPHAGGAFVPAWQTSFATGRYDAPTLSVVDDAGTKYVRILPSAVDYPTAAVGLALVTLELTNIPAADSDSLQVELGGSGFFINPGPRRLEHPGSYYSEALTWLVPYNVQNPCFLAPAFTLIGGTEDLVADALSGIAFQVVLLN